MIKFLKSLSALIFDDLFLKEAVHKCTRRETKNCINDIIVNALKRIHVGAFFEPYSSTIS